MSQARQLRCQNKVHEFISKHGQNFLLIQFHRNDIVVTIRFMTVLLYKSRRFLL